MARTAFDRMMSIDRRVIFLFIALAVIVPLFLNVVAKTQPTRAVLGAYEAMEALPPGSIVLVSCDYDPGTDVELGPMAESTFRHCFRRGLKFVIMGLWPQGPDLAEESLAFVMAEEEFSGKTFTNGVDYAILGYKAGGSIVLQSMGSSIPATFPVDKNGVPLDSLPIFKGVRNFRDIDLVMDLSAGDPGIPAWVMFGHDRFGVALVGGCTAVSAPGFYPYLQRGQIVGLLGGLKGAAEYEAALDAPRSASRFMLPQTIAHVVIVVFIVLGNVAYFTARKREKRA